jgi:hypothetical protein
MRCRGVIAQYFDGKKNECVKVAGQIWGAKYRNVGSISLSFIRRDRQTEKLCNFEHIGLRLRVLL